MDGDTAPLKEIVALAKKHDAYTFVGGYPVWRQIYETRMNEQGNMFLDGMLQTYAPCNTATMAQCAIPVILDRPPT